MKSRMFLLFILLIPSAWMQAQETVLTAGGTLSGNNGSVSYSIGQLAFSSFKGSEGSVTIGVQQPYEVSMETSIHDSGNDIDCVVFPNPTIDQLILKVKEIDNSKIAFELIDINGIILKSENINIIETQIDMCNYKQGIYFLSVKDDKKELRLFKIVKQ